MRELALAYRRKYRMSCEHVRVGSFGAITRVCQIGGEGHLRHLALPRFTEPQNRCFLPVGRWRGNAQRSSKTSGIFTEKIAKRTIARNEKIVFFCVLSAFGPSEILQTRLTRVETCGHFLLVFLSQTRHPYCWKIDALWPFWALGASGELGGRLG